MINLELESQRFCSNRAPKDDRLACSKLVGDERRSFQTTGKEFFQGPDDRIRCSYNQ